MTKMHDDELDIDLSLVESLIRQQFAQWADLSLRYVPSGGTDNALFRLGDKMVVRLPRLAGGDAQLHKEKRWLPFLAPYLPLAIPEPLALGHPTEGYPLYWGIYTWLEGEALEYEKIHDHEQLARDLAAFIMALQAIDTTDAPRPSTANFGRGVPLATRDEYTRKGIQQCEGLIDTDAALIAWERALAAPAHDGDLQWLHGDLLKGNMLMHNGRLSAVIDFGALAIGDPACDLQPAWNLLTAESRAVFREALGVDDAMWERGRGWSLSVGVIALPYYQHSNPYLAHISRRAIAAILSNM